jgi:hypothetical protein
VGEWHLGAQSRQLPDWGPDVPARPLRALQRQTEGASTWSRFCSSGAQSQRLHRRGEVRFAGATFPGITPDNVIAAVPDVRGVEDHR